MFADATDAIQAVDLTFDALINETGVSKMRVFLSDVLFEYVSNSSAYMSKTAGEAALGAAFSFWKADVEQ